MGAGRNGAVWAVGGAIALVLSAWSPSAAGPDRKLDRQIELMERVLDDVLVESPNWLVQGHHETRGRYRSGEGARFRFDASLVGSGRWHGSKWWKGWLDHDDVIVIDRDDWEDMDRDERKELRQDWSDRQVKRDERLYQRGKAELVDAILDYGDLLTAVPDGESLVIDVDLERAELFDEKDMRSLTLTAKMADVRAFAAGRIDEKTMVSRIAVSES